MRIHGSVRKSIGDPLSQPYLLILKDKPLTNNGYGLDFKYSKSKRKGKYESGSAHKNKENNPLTLVTNDHKYKYNYVLRGYNSTLVYKTFNLGLSDIVKRKKIFL
ncbi:Hypothetical predicted protein [Octopus vulgaris]|uniref:Uncharacterized protein n=1 Tax=Octopus vulgaris TaxID=6645 RepID=A0AA36F565_OCTVU|nr:Hypothetical predicted protein [Octopus vulgaris]